MFAGPRLGNGRDALAIVLDQQGIGPATVVGEQNAGVAGVAVLADVRQGLFDDVENLAFLERRQAEFLAFVVEKNIDSGFLAEALHHAGHGGHQSTLVNSQPIVGQQFAQADMRLLDGGSQAADLALRGAQVLLVQGFAEQFDLQAHADQPLGQ